MYIIVIAWIYVVLLMSLTEHSIVAGIMTFMSYGILPLAIVLYIVDTPRRMRMNKELSQNKTSPASMDSHAHEEHHISENEA
jgi:hypothetical protein